MITVSTGRSPRWRWARGWGSAPGRRSARPGPPSRRRPPPGSSRERPRGCGRQSGLCPPRGRRPVDAPVQRRGGEAARQRRLLHLRLINGGQLNKGNLGPPVCIVFEGWDRRRQGRAIKRLVEPLEPGTCISPRSPRRRRRGLRHHFLWRFWPATCPDGAA